MGFQLQQPKGTHACACMHTRMCTHAETFMHVCVCFVRLVNSYALDWRLYHCDQNGSSNHKQNHFHCSWHVTMLELDLQLEVDQWSKEGRICVSSRWTFSCSNVCRINQGNHAHISLGSPSLEPSSLHPLVHGVWMRWDTLDWINNSIPLYTVQLYCQVSIQLVEECFVVPGTLIIHSLLP